MAFPQFHFVEKLEQNTFEILHMEHIIVFRLFTAQDFGYNWTRVISLQFISSGFFEESGSI